MKKLLNKVSGTLAMPKMPGLVLFAARLLKDPGTLFDFAYNRLRPANGTVLLERQRGCYLSETAPAFVSNAFLESCEKIIAEKENVAVELKPPAKPYFYNMLSESDLFRYPALLDFVFSHELLEGIETYLGLFPQLSSIGVYRSRIVGQESLEGSQKYHFDTFEKNHVKVFVNLRPVTPLNGPVTFIPANVSKALCTNRIAYKLETLFSEAPDRSQLGHELNSRVLPRKNVSLEMLTRSTLKLVGPAGSTAIVDTARCLHSGSRVQEGERYVFLAHYTNHSKYLNRPANDHLALRPQYFSEELTRFINSRYPHLRFDNAAQRGLAAS
jgi:hypothetical protein